MGWSEEVSLERSHLLKTQIIRKYWPCEDFGKEGIVDVKVLG